MECTSGAEIDTRRRNRKAMKEHTGMRKANMIGVYKQLYLCSVFVLRSYIGVPNIFI